MRHEYRYKAIVIPKVGEKYLVVKDAKYNEYTFVTGGCKKRETSVECASRELYEETHGALLQNIAPAMFAFSFESRNRSKQELQKDKREGVIVTMVYNVYILNTNQSFQNIRKHYYSNKQRNNAQNETDGIYVMSKQELQQSPKTWRFMKEYVLPRL